MTTLLNQSGWLANRSVPARAFVLGALAAAVIQAALLLGSAAGISPLGLGGLLLWFDTPGWPIYVAIFKPLALPDGLDFAAQILCGNLGWGLIAAAAALTLRLVFRTN